jgi:hypothetical protein
MFAASGVHIFQQFDGFLRLLIDMSAIDAMRGNRELAVIELSYPLLFLQVP